MKGVPRSSGGSGGTADPVAVDCTDTSVCPGTAEQVRLSPICARSFLIISVLILAVASYTCTLFPDHIISYTGWSDKMRYEGIGISLEVIFFNLFTIGQSWNNLMFMRYMPFF